MTFDQLALPAVLLVAITSLVLLIASQWRIQLVFLAVQYIGVFLLVSSSWNLAMSVTKIVAGWISGAVLGLALLNLPETNRVTNLKKSSTPNWTTPLNIVRRFTSVYLFQILTAILVILIVISISPNLRLWIPNVKLIVLWGALILIGMGTLQLGFNQKTLNVILGLLTVLSGFEILYAGIESSSLVAGLLSVINLGLAIIGAYLMVTFQMEETD